MFLETELQHSLEFQAIILSGVGSRMYPLTEESNLPKALLPIANKPMIYYTLQWLEKSNISDVIIAVLPEATQKLSTYVHERYETNMNIQVVEVPADSGTAEAVRSLKGLIKTNFLVISCDLITDAPPHIILNPHRVMNNTMTALYFDASNVESAERLNKEEGEIVGINDSSSRLLFSLPRADIVNDELDLKRSLLQKFPQVRLHSNLRDAHLYVFKLWVLDLIVKNKAITSIKNDLIPLLLQCQYRNALVKKEGIDTFIRESSTFDIFAAARELSLSKNFPPKVSCVAVVYRQGFSARSNTVWSYGEMNRIQVKNMAKITIPDTCEISPKSQIGSDCLLGDGAVIAEKSSIKRSIIGNHVNIGKHCKVTNCVIMDYVVIEDGVKLDNCILCRGARISQRCELKDCEVAGQYKVPADTHAKNEHLIPFMVDQ